MRTSESTANVFAAFVGAQAALDSAKKGAENPAFKRDGKNLKYAALSDHWSAIQPVAQKPGLAIVQELLSAEHGVEVVTRICHVSGEWIECGPLFVPATKADAHGYGSACSYARRYALSAAFGTVADDDDGNAAVASKSTPYASPTPLGYDEWAIDLETQTADGIDAFRAVYSASKLVYRKHMEKLDAGKLAALVAKAKASSEGKAA